TNVNDAQTVVEWELADHNGDGFPDTIVSDTRAMACVTGEPQDPTCASPNCHQQFSPNGSNVDECVCEVATEQLSATDACDDNAAHAQVLLNRAGVLATTFSQSYPADEVNVGDAQLGIARWKTDHWDTNDPGAAVATREVGGFVDFHARGIPDYEDDPD